MSRPYSFAAPVRGWIENENLAANGGNGASIMDNWFPMQATVRLRGGALKVADVGSDAVLSVIPYRGAVPKLFAATASAVYDVTALDADATLTAAFSGQSSGRWSHTQFGTAGGTFLVMVNGANDLRVFDGATWTAINGSSTPSVSGVATSALSHVWMHGSRLWFVQGGTMKAWYLPVDQIGGALTEFNMGAVFKRGGALLFGAAWSSDSGDGMDDRCVFVTTEGEVAVYQGTDPNDAETWAKVGVYDVSEPISTQTVSLGGDLLLMTADGIVPMSQVVTKDPAALSLAAITAAIDPSWRRAVRTRDGTKPFVIEKVERESMLLVGLPHRAETFVANLKTGAWARYTGWDVQSVGLHNGRLYFGDSAGNVFLAEGAGADNGAPYVCRLQLLPDHMGGPGRYKTYQQARATFRALAPFSALLSAATDYQRDFLPAPNAAADDASPALWDVGEWDVSRWDDGPESEERQTITTLWQSIGASGFSVGPQVQVTCGGAWRPDAELVALDMTFVPGETVV